MSRKTLAVLAILATLPATALAADAVGDTGRIVNLQVNRPSSPTYLQYHGRVFIEKGKNVDEYRWGGTSCGSRTLVEHDVMMLMRALDSGLQVTPQYQSGQGSTACLVSYTISG